jgi:hypothetical protein
MIPQLAMYALGAGANAVQAFQAQKTMRKAQEASQKAFQEMKAIKEINPFKQVQVPTLGSQLAQQSLDRATTGAINAVQSSNDPAAAFAGLGGIVQANVGQGIENAAMLNEAQFKRDAMQAEAESGIQARKGERDFLIGQNEVMSAEQQRADAQANRDTAIMGIGSSLKGAAGLMGDYFKETPGGTYSDFFKSKGTPQKNVNEGNMEKLKGILTEDQIKAISLLMNKSI